LRSYGHGPIRYERLRVMWLYGVMIHMGSESAASEMAGFLPRDEFNTLFAVLRATGYRVVGPQVRDGAIVFDTLDDAARLPSGIGDVQGPGRYRLQHGKGLRCFAWAVGPQALKPLVFRPRQILWSCERSNERLRFHAGEDVVDRVAVVGVRACDLAALALQDAHFLDGPVRDPHYAHAREHLLLIAVHCTHPAATCFCASTGDGPRARHGFDLALSEGDDGFIVETGSVAGERIARQLVLRPVRDHQVAAATSEIERAARSQRRQLPGGIRGRLRVATDHPRWEEVARRCLSCGNCTSVCPTCFCHREIESPVLDGHSSEHAREWDSCFTQQHSYIHGFTVRAETRTRYRQWLTHKLDTWFDQYGRSGCVGCGRCITWCPVGIDITEEAEAMVSGASDRG